MIKFSDLANAIAGVRGHAAQLRNRLEKLRQERDDILAAPACRADIKAAYAAWFERRRQEYRKALGAHIAGVIAKPTRFLADTSATDNLDRWMSVLAVGPNPANAATVRSIDAAEAALFGDEMQRALFDVIDRLEWLSPEGLPMAERTKRVAELDGEIARLQAELDEVARAANAVRAELG